MRSLTSLQQKHTRLGISAVVFDIKYSFYWHAAVILWFYCRGKALLSTPQKLTLNFFLFSSLLWSLQFGYMRFAPFLELLGGLLLLMFFNLTGSKVVNKGSSRFMGIQRAWIWIPVLIFVFHQNYKLVQINLMKDYSWRPPLYQNIQTHQDQIPHLWNKTISLPHHQTIPHEEIDVILNCEVPSSAYYMLTELRDKPLVLLKGSLNSEYLMNPAYRGRVFEKLMERNGNQPMLTFAAFMTGDKNSQSENVCRRALRQINSQTDQEIEIPDFLSYKGGKLILIIGRAPLDAIQSQTTTP